MKKSILILLTAFYLFCGCGANKKIKESENTNKNTSIKDVKSVETFKKSIEVLPTESVINYNIEDLKESGNFQQTVESGNGTKSTITKKGPNLILKTKTSGSKTSETEMATNQKIEIYDSEFIIKESKKIVKRVPIKFWIIIGLIVIIYFRKFLSQLLVAMFPALASKRLIKLFINT